MKQHRYFLIVIILFLTLRINAQDTSNDSSSENFRIFGLYSGTFQSKSGITVGLTKNKNGFYFSGRYGKFTRTDTKNTIYDNHWINERYSITIGYIREFNKFIDIFGGLGYGYLGYQYMVDDFDSNDWISYLNDYGNDSKTYQSTDKGLESEIGLIFHYKFLYANIGLSTLNIKNVTPIYGIGFEYKF